MRRSNSPEHSVQLFDDDESLAAGVAPFLHAGYKAGESLLVVATPEHWSAIEARLVEAGMPVQDAVRCGTLTVCDAATTLKSFAPYGWHDPVLFEQAVGTMLDALTAGGRRLRVYGEMVDLLAAEGRLESAQRLEETWNELVARKPFTLFCGYSAAHFGNPRDANALQRICAAHSHVRSNPHDVLATFLLESARTPA